MSSDWILDHLGRHVDESCDGDQGMAKQEWVKEALESKVKSGHIIAVAKLNHGRLYAKLFKLFPAICTLALSVGGALDSESFSERIISAVKLCMTRFRHKLSTESLRDLGMGRINRPYRRAKRRKEKM